MQKSKKELFKDFVDCLKQIQLSIDNYSDENDFPYKSISVQLRILFCDQNPLYEKLFPDLKLHPLLRGGMNNWPQSLKDSCVLFIQGRIHFPGNAGKCEIVKLFDADSQNLLPIEQWLNQTLLVLEKTPITIRDIIRSVANKDGGAHVDSKLDHVMIKGARIKINGQKGYISYLMAISKYIIESLSGIIDEQQGGIQTIEKT